jgi:DNA-binding FadR family transcriptional regulator
MLAGGFTSYLGSSMRSTIELIKIKSIKDTCVERLEELILSGELSIGERLPSERNFAFQMGVSRPVLHEALVDLDAKGLVQIIPRRGVYVCDYRRSGSLSILSSLLAYHNGKLDFSILQSLIDMRLVVETEAARLAALNRTPEQLAELYKITRCEQGAVINQPQALTESDYLFHLSIAIASGNLIYPLVINSFKGVYTSITGEFFQKYCGTQVVDSVIQYHVKLVDALDRQDQESSRRIMMEVLKHGEIFLKGES